MSNFLKMQNNTTTKLMEQNNNTAIDFLICELKETGIDLGSGIKMAYPISDELIRRAKHMEKFQIERAHDISKSKVFIYENGSDYYKQTYGELQ